MVPDQLVQHKGRNSKSYELINVSELPRFSNCKVEVICDYCGKHYYATYFSVSQRHLRTGIEKDACRECIRHKREELNELKYGVKSTTELEDVKRKMKNTNLARYGVENAMQNSSIYEKARNTVFMKYGVYCVAKLDSVKEKRKETCLIRYGKEFYSSTEECKDKIKHSNFLKYGCDYPMQNEEYRNLIHKHVLEKYGVDYISQLQCVKDKVAKTCLDHWGTSSFSGSEEYKRICLERYGYEFPFLQPYAREKSAKSFYLNGSCPTSQAQLWIYEYLNSHGFNVELNYPFSRANLDVALFCCQKQIDIEFDGRYWHQDKEKDNRRDFFMLDNQWNVIRFIGDRNPPSETQLLDAINKSLCENRRRLIINLI